MKFLSFFLPQRSNTLQLTCCTTALLKSECCGDAQRGAEQVFNLTVTGWPQSSLAPFSVLHYPAGFGSTSTAFHLLPASCVSESYNGTPSCRVGQAVCKAKCLCVHEHTRKRSKLSYTSPERSSSRSHLAAQAADVAATWRFWLLLLQLQHVVPVLKSLPLFLRQLQGPD